MKTIFVVSIGTALFGAFDDIDQAKRYTERLCGIASGQSWERMPTHDNRRMLELHHNGKVKGLIREVPHAPVGALAGSTDEQIDLAVKQKYCHHLPDHLTNKCVSCGKDLQS